MAWYIINDFRSNFNAVVMGHGSQFVWVSGSLVSGHATWPIAYSGRKQQNSKPRTFIAITCINYVFNTLNSSDVCSVHLRVILKPNMLLTQIGQTDLRCAGVDCTVRNHCFLHSTTNNRPMVVVHSVRHRRSHLGTGTCVLRGRMIALRASWLGERARRCLQFDPTCLI